MLVYALGSILIEDAPHTNLLNTQNIYLAICFVCKFVAGILFQLLSIHNKNASTPANPFRLYLLQSDNQFAANFLYGVATKKRCGK